VGPTMQPPGAEEGGQARGIPLLRGGRGPRPGLGLRGAASPRSAGGARPSTWTVSAASSCAGPTRGPGPTRQGGGRDPRAEEAGPQSPRPRLNAEDAAPSPRGRRQSVPGRGATGVWTCRAGRLRPHRSARLRASAGCPPPLPQPSSAAVAARRPRPHADTPTARPRPASPAPFPARLASTSFLKLHGCQALGPSPRNTTFGHRYSLRSCSPVIHLLLSPVFLPS
jgi:hypothetical protein